MSARRHRRGLVCSPTAGLLLGGALLASCQHGPTAAGPPGAAGSASATPAAAAPWSLAPPPAAQVAAPVPAPLKPAAGALGCRVISSTGPAQRESGASVSAGDRFVGADWLELGKATRLHLKHGQSGREWTLSGPARVLPCIEGLEELIVAEGKLRTEAGAGVRPGAQVLIGTPFGSLRYADASAELEVTPASLRLVVSAGDTWLSATNPSSGSETHTTGAHSTRRGARERLAPASAVAACERAARQAEALAKSLLAPALSGLGKLAAEHVRARELARASCATATAAVLQQSTGSERTARLAELASYRELWRHIPAAGG
ncbi:MAG: hypothetical protein ABI895_29785 [Deltaproteobacteria bacterium]